jgi:hypothetical protein
VGKRTKQPEQRKGEKGRGWGEEKEGGGGEDERRGGRRRGKEDW